MRSYVFFAPDSKSPSSESGDKLASAIPEDRHSVVSHFMQRLEHKPVAIEVLISHCD